MEIVEEIAEFLERLANVASRMQKWLGCFLVLAVGLSVFLAWHLYSPESQAWWNTLKCGVVMIPSMSWVLIWFLLEPLKDAPATVSSLATRDDISLGSLRERFAGKKLGLVNLFSTVREMRDNEALESVTESIGSLSLLANPLFMVFAFIMWVVMLIVMMAAPLVFLL